MAVWHIKSGGTRAVGSGASTADDWTDANCFDPDANAGSRWWNVARDYMTDGDEMIFYDDGATVTTHDLATGNMLAAANAGTLTFKSKSGSADYCTVRCITSATMFDLKPNSTAGISYIFDGLKFAEPSVGHTTAHSAFVSAENLCEDITFNNCNIGNIEMASASGESLEGLINSDDTTARTISFTGTNYIENITSSVTWVGGSFIGQFKTGNTILISGTLYIRNITLTPVNNIRGGFFDNAIYNITGDVIISDINNTVNATKYNRSVFYGGDQDFTCTGTIKANNLTATGGTSGAMVVIVANTHDIRNVAVDNITVTRGSGENSVGTVILALGSSAQGTVKNVRATNLSGYSGGAVYHSDGAGGTIESIYVNTSTMGENGAAVYSGGDGDSTIIGVEAINCNATDGGAIFAHNHPVSSSRNKTVEIYNVSISGCSASNNGQGIYLNNDNATYTLTSTIKNVVVRNGSGTDEINLGEGATATHTATITNSNIEGDTTGIDSADISNGSLSTSDIIDSATESSNYGIGVKYWTGPNPVGADGEPFSDWDTDIGGIQSKNSPFHPFNL